MEWVEEVRMGVGEGVRREGRKGVGFVGGFGSVA